MTILTLNNIVLSMSTSTRIIRKGVLLNEKLMESARQVPACRVDPKTQMEESNWVRTIVEKIR